MLRCQNWLCKANRPHHDGKELKMDTKVKIKKYANRRLYDMTQSFYINISNIADLVRSGLTIEVTDAKTGEDLTAATLLQLYLDLENEGKGVLTGKALMHILRRESQDGVAALNQDLHAALADDAPSAHAQALSKGSLTPLGEPVMNKELIELRTAFSQFTKAFRKFDDKGS